MLGPNYAAIAVGTVSLLFFPLARWLLNQFVPKSGEGLSGEYVSFGIHLSSSVVDVPVFLFIKGPRSAEKCEI